MKNRRTKIAILISLLIVLLLVSSVFAIYKINEPIEYYTDLRLLSYEINNPNENDESLSIVNIIFNQVIDIEEAQKNIYVASDADGTNIINDVNVDINPDDFGNVIVTAPKDGYEIGDYYLFIKEGLSTKEPGYRPLIDREMISFTIRSGPYLEKWGLGKKETKSVHLDRPYDWYMSQSNTGKYSYNNCGPASTTMAIKWSKKDFDKTPEDARNQYRSGGGWWYTDDIRAYLNKNDVNNYEIDLFKIESLTEELDKGNIVILCLDTTFIRENLETPEEHVDLYYDGSWGHFIVAKGYRIVDNKTYIEIYDPYMGEMEYEDGSYKGKDRYYRAEDIILATKDWCNFAIVVTDD